MLHIAAHQTVSIAGGPQNNQLDRRSPPVNVSKTPSLAIPVLAKWVSAEYSHSVTDRGQARAPNQNLPVIKANLATVTAAYPTCGSTGQH